MPQIIIKPKAEKRFAKFNKSDQNRITSAISKIARDPSSNNLNIRKLSGTKGKFYRIRLGDIRMIYEIKEELNLINVHLINFRGNVY